MTSPGGTSDNIGEYQRGFVSLLENTLPGDLDDLVDGFNRVVENFNESWWKQGVIIRWAMKDAIEKVREWVQKLIDVAEVALKHYVPVLSLFETAMDWTDKVMTPLSEIYGQVPPGQGNRDLAYWDDAARKVYDEIVTEQQNATGAARDLARFMSGWLSEIGKENTTYATHLVRVIGSVVKDLATMAIEVAEVIGSPFALQDFADTIGTAVQALFDTLAKIAEDVTSAVDRVINADNEVSDHSYFPDGEWPKAVARA